jgi:hypothetical protein
MLKTPPSFEEPTTLRLPVGPWANTPRESHGAERRLSPRKAVSAQIEGKRIDHSLAALRSPHVSLALRDLSAGGLSAISQTPLQRGERLSVSFPTQGLGTALQGGWDATGRVLRCEPSALGYRVAVEFETVPTAA